LIFTAKRTTTISKNVLAASHCVISFQQRMGADVDRLERMYSAGDAVRDLGRYEFVMLGSQGDAMPYHDALSSHEKYSVP
jgi:hypothetical protein